MLAAFLQFLCIISINKLMHFVIKGNNITNCQINIRTLEDQILKIRIFLFCTSISLVELFNH